MLKQLGTLYERQMAANDAIKQARQKPGQTPTELLNYLRPQWDELEQTSNVAQVFDFFNALRTDIRQQLDLLPQEKRQDFPTLEEQANIIWRRIKQTPKIKDEGQRPGKRHYDDDDVPRGQKGAGGHKKPRTNAPKDRGRPERQGRVQTDPTKPTCYNCGEKGHKKPDCTKPQEGDGNKYRPVVSGKVRGQKG